MPIPTNQLPVGDGLHPDGKPDANFYVDKAELSIMEDDGPEWKFEDARFIQETVREPDVIFTGLKRPGHENCFAYSVRLTRDPAEDDAYGASSPRYGYVFMAFARHCFGGYMIFDWEWREEDSDSPGHPVNWNSDFERRTWLKT